MPVNSVTLTGTLTLPSGLPVAMASIRFTLSNPGLKGITVVVPISIRATADASGAFSLKLAPNSKNTYYTVTVYRSTGVVLLETVAIIPEYDCQFAQVIQTGQPTSLSAAVSAIVDLRVALADVEAAKLGVIATADATNTSSQASLIKLQTAVNSYEVATANNQETIVTLVNTATGTTLDLVTAYQLST